jgi:hypothetical protein
MDTITVEAGDDVAAIVKALGAQLPNPANSLSLLARFVVRESDRDTVKSGMRGPRLWTSRDAGFSNSTRIRKIQVASSYTNDGAASPTSRFTFERTIPLNFAPSCTV